MLILKWYNEKEVLGMVNRQKIRKAVIIISVILFPITYYYFSPYLIIDGASQGIISGSFIMFATFFCHIIIYWSGVLWLDLSSRRTARVVLQG